MISFERISCIFLFTALNFCAAFSSFFRAEYSVCRPAAFFFFFLIVVFGGQTQFFFFSDIQSMASHSSRFGRLFTLTRCAARPTRSCFGGGHRRGRPPRRGSFFFFFPDLPVYQKWGRDESSSDYFLGSRHFGRLRLGPGIG